MFAHIQYIADLLLHHLQYFIMNNMYQLLLHTLFVYIDYCAQLLLIISFSTQNVLLFYMDVDQPESVILCNLLSLISPPVTNK